MRTFLLQFAKPAKYTQGRWPLDPAFAVNKEDETSPIRFHSEQITASFLSPDGSEVMKSLEVRFDPLLGTSSRIAEGVVLSKAMRAP